MNELGKRNHCSRS